MAMDAEVVANRSPLPTSVGNLVVVCQVETCRWHEHEIAGWNAEWVRVLVLVIEDGAATIVLEIVPVDRAGFVGAGAAEAFVGVAERLRRRAARPPRRPPVRQGRRAANGGALAPRPPRDGGCCLQRAMHQKNLSGIRILSPGNIGTEPAIETLPLAGSFVRRR